MATVCPACGTENRSVAKFCIECIKPLPTDFAATQVLAAPPQAQPLDEMPPALAAFASANASPYSMPQAPISVPSVAAALPPPATARMGLGIGVGVGITFFALLLAGTIGWLAAGGQFWRGSDEHAAPPASAAVGARATSGVVEAAVQPPSAVPALTGESRPVDSLAPGETILPVDAATRATVAAPAPSAAPVATAPMVAGSVATSAGDAPLPKTKSAAAAARPESGADLFSRCAGLGFISASRCKVEVCESGAHHQRKECQPVLAQQRLMEEKRNPTMAN